MTDIIILFCTSALGYLVGQAWEKHQLRKEKLYCNLYEFCVKFRANITTSKMVLPAFVQEFCASASKDFVSCCNSFLFGKQTKFNLVKGNEYHYLEKFFAGLDANNQVALMDHLNYFCHYFNSVLSQVQMENKSKAKLGLKLGLLCGVIVGLVLV